MKGRAATVFGALGSVVGVGVTWMGDGYGVKVNVAATLPTAGPTAVDGVSVRVELVGRVTKQ